MQGYLKKDKLDKSTWRKNHVKRYFELNFKTATLIIKKEMQDYNANNIKNINFRDIIDVHNLDMNQCEIPKKY